MTLKIKKSQAYGATTVKIKKNGTYQNMINILRKVASTYQSINVPLGAANVLYVAGQSQTNCNGTMLSGYDVPTALQGPMANVFIWNPFTLSWGVYEAGVNSSPHINGAGGPGSVEPEYYGPEAEFARRWKIDNPGVPLFIVKRARSSSALSTTVPSAPAYWQVSANDLYAKLKTDALNAHAKLASMGYTVNPRSFIWVHGESDAGTATAYNSYDANLTTLINTFRTDVIGASCPVVVGRVKDAGSNPTGFAAVRAAQQLIGERETNVRWCDLDGMSLSGGDGFHWGPPGVVEMGRRTYDTSAIGTDIVAKYVARMTVPASAPDQALMATMVEAIVKRGAWETIAFMNLYCQDTAQAALLNLKPGVAQTSVNAGMTFTPRIGFTGVGTTSGVNTGVIPNDAKNLGLLSAASSTYGIYSRSDQDGQVDLGANGAGCGILFPWGGIPGPGVAKGQTGGFRLNNDTFTSTFVFPLTYNGCWIASRTSNSIATLYKDQTKIGDDLNPNGTSLPTIPVYVGNRNNANNVGGTKSYQMFLAGRGMTAYHTAAVSAAINAYITAMGAN